MSDVFVPDNSSAAAASSTASSSTTAASAATETDAAAAVAGKSNVSSAVPEASAHETGATWLSLRVETKRRTASLQTVFLGA